MQGTVDLLYRKVSQLTKGRRKKRTVVCKYGTRKDTFEKIKLKNNGKNILSGQLCHKYGNFGKLKASQPRLVNMVFYVL